MARHLNHNTFMNSTEGIYGAQSIGFLDRYNIKVAPAHTQLPPTHYLDGEVHHDPHGIPRDPSQKSAEKHRDRSQERPREKSHEKSREKSFERPKERHNAAPPEEASHRPPSSKHEASVGYVHTTDTFPYWRISPEAEPALKSTQRSHTPNYRPVGTSYTKNFSHKADLRFDVRDINRKSPKLKVEHDPRIDQKHLAYLKAQNLHLYDKYIPADEIAKKQYFFEGERVELDPRVYGPPFKRSLSARVADNEEFLRTARFRNNPDPNTTQRETFEHEQRKEAHAKFSNEPVIIREKGVRLMHEDKRLPMSQSGNLKIGRTIK